MLLVNWLFLIRLRLGLIGRKRRRVHSPSRRNQNRTRPGEPSGLNCPEALEERILLSAPSAADDYYFVQDATAWSVSASGVLGNDSDPDSDPLTAQQVSGPANGTLTLNPDGSFTYTPDTGFQGTDSFSYQAFDGVETSSAALVTLDVGDVAGDSFGSERLVSVADGQSVELGGLIGDGSYGDADVDMFQVTLNAGDSLTVNIDAAQLDDGSALSGLDSYLRIFDEYGSEVASNGDGTDPQTGLPSSDSVLTFTASSPGTYTIGVSGAGDEYYDPYSPGMGSSGSTGQYQLHLSLAANTPPAFDSSSYSFTVPADAQYGDVVGTVSATDSEGDMFSYYSNSSFPFEVDSSTGEIRYADSSMLTVGNQYNFTVNADDMYGSGSATVMIDVTAPNNTPPAFDSSSYSFTVTSDATYGTSVGTVTAADPDGDSFSYSSNSSFPFEVDSSTGEIRYADSSMLTVGNQYNFTVNANDMYGSGSATVTIDVVAPNQPPVANADTSTTPYATAVTVDVLANDSDPEGEALTLVSVSTPAHGQAVLSNGQVVYTPNSSFAGDEAFTYVVADPEGNSSTGNVTVTVTNNPPVAVDDQVTTDSQTAVTVDVLGNDSDPEGSALSVASVAQPAHGSVALVNGDVVYTPDGVFLGDETFDYTVQDAAGATATATVTVTVAPLELTAVDDTVNVAQDGAGVIGVTDNDLIPQGSTLTVTIGSAATNGSAAVNGLSIEYAPTAGYVGLDSFTYTLTDQDGNTSTATVNVTVFANEPPVAADDDLEIEAGSGKVLDVLANDSDPEGGPLTIVEASATWLGTVTIAPGQDGEPDQLVYDSPADTYGIETVTYTIADEWGRTATATATVWISPRPAPDIADLGLVNDTGDVGDRVSTDVRVTGTVETSIDVAGLAVDVDYNGDQAADAVAEVDSYDLTFTYDFASVLTYGDATVYLRAVELDADGQVVTTGDWQEFQFTYVEQDDPDPTNDADPNSAVLTSVTVDQATADLVQLSGTVDNVNGGTAAAVEFDVDGDGTPDAEAATTNDAFTQQFTTEVGYGDEVVVRVRTRDVDDGTGDMLYGAWQPVGFSRDYPVNDPPLITQLGLANDTDTPDDNITSDATVIGTISHADGSLEGNTIEYDLNGDDIYDGTVITDASGQFTIDLNSAGLDDGAVSLRVRSREWDSARKEQLHSDWSTLDFQYTGAAARLPSLSGLALANDTGTAGDGVTSDPTIAGTFVSGTAALSQTGVEIDLNGDGVPDDRFLTVDPGTGSFTVDLSDYLSTSGPVTVDLRASGWDDAAQEALQGDWVEFTFTYEAPPPATAQVTDLALVNDTGTVGDGITSDPRISGKVTHPSESVSGASVQYDLDGDGAYDGETTADGRGRFSIDLTDASLALGSVTVAVRAGVWSAAELGDVWGDWASFTFTLEAAATPTRPEVTQLQLLDDDDGDGTVSRATISGTVTDGDSAVQLLPVEFDVDGDGTAEGRIYTDTTGSGNFLVDLTPFLQGDGARTVYFRAAESDTDDSTFGDWASFSFTFQAASDTSQDDLVDDNPVPFTSTDLSHVQYETGDLGIGLTVENTDSTTAGTFASGYVQVGSVVGTSDLLAAIADADISEDTPTNTSDSTTDANGNTTDVAQTGTWQRTVTTITDQATGEWYRYENVVQTYDTVTDYTAADGSGYDFHQWGTYGYTLTAYGYNGNAVYTLVEYRTDNYENQQWTAADPNTLFVITGSQSDDVESGGYVKVNDDGLAAPGSTTSWSSQVDTVDPTIGTYSYAASAYGRLEYTDSTGSGSVDTNGEYSDSWSQTYSSEADTPAGSGTTLTEVFSYHSVHDDPYDITNQVNVNETTNLGGVSRTTVIDETTTLTGAKTDTFDSSGTRTTYADGTYESAITQTSTREMHDTYNYNGTRTYTVADNSDPNATVNEYSNSTGTATRQRDVVQVYGATTTRLVDGTQTVAGTVDGNTSSSYSESGGQDLNSDGTSDDGTTVMSFSTTGTTHTSANGTYLMVTTGTFGTAGKDITNTYDTTEAGSSDWNYTAQGNRDSSQDDGAGNTSLSGGTSSSTNDGNTSYSNTMHVDEHVTDAGVTSTGTMNHTGNGNGSSSYDDTEYNTTTTATGTTGNSSSSYNDSSNYGNGSGTWTSTSTGTGTITNGQADYTQTDTRDENGSFASGNSNTFTSHSESDDGYRTETNDSSGGSKYDETGTYSSSTTDTTHSAPAGDSSSSSSTYSKQADTTWSSNSKTSNTIHEDYSSEDYPGSGTYESWHDESHSGSSTDSGSGNYSLSESANSSTAADGTSTSSTDSSYNSSGSGTTTTSGSDTITDHSHSDDNNGVTSTSDRTSSITRSGTTTYQNTANGTSNETDGASSSTDSTSSVSDTTSTVHTQSDTVQDSDDTNASDKATSDSHSESHATDDTTTTSHEETGSVNQQFADGTSASQTTDSGSSDSTGTFTTSTSADSTRDDLGVMLGITSHVAKSSSSNSTGDSTSHSDWDDEQDTYADGTWSTSSSSSGNSTVNTTGDSSATDDANRTDASTSTTKTSTTHAHTATTNAKRSVTSNWSSDSTNGSAGGTTVSWSTEDVTDSGDVESDSNSKVRAEKDADNFSQTYNEESKNGSYNLTGSSRDDRFADGTTSSTSTLTRTETGTSTRKEENTGKSKQVSHPQPGLTQTLTSDQDDTSNWTDITYTDTYSLNTDDPVDAPLTSTEITSHTESGKQSWNSTDNGGSSLTGTVNNPDDPDDESNGTVFNSSSSSTTTEVGSGDYSDSDTTTVKVDNGVETTTGSGSDSLDGNSTLTTTGNSSGSITQNRKIGDTTVNFNQTSSSNSKGTVLTKIDDSSSFETDGKGGTKSTTKSSPTTSGFSTSSSTKTTTVTMTKSGYNFTKTEQDIDKSTGSFDANLSHTIDTDFDGTTTHSGGGSSTTKSWSLSKNTVNSTTFEKKTALYSTWKGYYNQVVTYNQLDQTTTKSDGNASLTYQTDGTETWGGTQTDQKDIIHDKKKTTTRIDNVTQAKTNRDFDGYEEDYKKTSGSFTEDKTHEENHSKTKHQIQSDGSLDAGEDVLDPDIKAAIIEKHEKAGSSDTETWDEKSSPSSGVGVMENWKHVQNTDGTDKGYIYWSKGSGDFYREYYDKTGVSETIDNYKYERKVFTATETSTETIHDDSTSSSGSSESKIVTPTGDPNSPIDTQEWTKTFNTREDTYHHANNGTRTNTYQGEMTPYEGTISYDDTTKSDWDWTYDRHEKYDGSESQQRPAGSDTATAKVDSTWDLTVDYHGTWDDTENINSTSATDNSTMSITNTSHEEATIHGVANVTYSAQYDISGLNDDQNPPVVTPVGDPQPVATWSWVEDWTGKANSTGSATIEHYMQDYTWDEATQTYTTTWESKDFGGSWSDNESYHFSASDSDPNGTENSPPGTYSSNMDNADFLSSYMYIYMDHFYTRSPDVGNGRSADYTDFKSDVDMAAYEPTMDSYSFTLFASLDPSWIDQLAISLYDAFQENFPELSNLISSTWEYASFFASDLFRQFDDGTMADRAFGLIDGFLDGINPFNQWISVPDIGPVFGHVEDYAFSKTVGTFAGVATGIAISMMGPGLVSCGTFAHKAMVAWEVADAVGGIGGAVQNIYNNGGQVGVMDALAIAGGVVSIGGLKGLMNKCFVGDTAVVYDQEDIFTAVAAPERQAADAPWNLNSLILGGGLLMGMGAGWFLATRRRLAAHEEPLRRKKKTVLELFGDPQFLDRLWLPPGVKRPLPAFALPGAANCHRLMDDWPSPAMNAVPPLPKEPPVPDVAGPNSDVAGRKEPAPRKESVLSSRRFGWLMMLICLLGSGLCFWQALPGVFLSASPAAVQAGPPPERQTKLLTRKIRDIRPGMRVLADNPELADEVVEPLDIDPAQWRLVTLETAKADGNVLTVELLRPHGELLLAIVAAERLEDRKSSLPDVIDLACSVRPTIKTPVRLCQGAALLPAIFQEMAAAKARLDRGEPIFAAVSEDHNLIRRTLHLNLPEMGAVGPARITAVAPCPPIEEGKGRIVTGRFIHQAANVIDLKISGLDDPIGTTDTHPFWSEDRHAFVPAGELRIGEELRSLSGEKTYVLAKTPRGPPEDVFNLEVEGEHVYYVAESGVIVHNMCADKAGKGVKSWIMQGAESDKYYNELSRAEKLLYMRGQKTFSGGFWKKNKDVLEAFTAGKTGRELVQGIVERGKWLKKFHPIRSSSLNIIDFFRGIGTTISSGPDPASRKILMWLFRIKE